MTEADRYQTLAGRSEAASSVRGSEFVAYAAPARSVADAEGHVAAVRDAHGDATHVVTAYRVRTDPFREYADDDGEPPGSAGRPVLAVLQGRDLENVAVAVARYFGGTELGVGGLVRAYAETAAAAVDADEVIEERPHEQFAVVVDYDDSGTVRSVLESEAVEFDAAYAERVSFAVRVPLEETATLRDRLLSATGGRAQVERSPEDLSE